ncbi:multicopper oxidase domain-containing protein [Fodinibius saliphilus]|uniref:multicopper oxidase domain-containing protein n=1 Tax=Fodinibius saliphilus TaxID=1920650 RepID=UPI0011087699|nr:multicopper oxidase domain-containing protein [Fodinibius saliphilus]
MFDDKIPRKLFLKSGLITGASALLGSIFFGSGDSQGVGEQSSEGVETDEPAHPGVDHNGMTAIGKVDHEKNGFDPHEMLTDWDTGKVSTLPNGQRLREFQMIAVDKEIEVAPGIHFPAWTYNGRVPGPTMRCTEGDRVRVEFINSGSHPHTIHFHGIHSATMDGVPGNGPGIINPGESFTYEFDAEPFGCHLYHCHSMPLKRHMHKGLYGGFIVDPAPENHPEFEEVARSRLLGTPENEEWQELFMVMNGFDTNFDADNEIYAANTVAFAYQQKPIPIKHDKPTRVYLVNVTEFDPINSFHLHANFFDYYDHGTTLYPTKETIDTVMLCQAQRGILEFSFEDFEPGRYMFHAHQAEFAELGWMSFFEVINENKDVV